MGTRARRWIRVSSGGQDEANQVPDISAYGEQRGYEWVGGDYELHDKSASKGEQQSYLDMAFRDMAAGEFDVLVCWHSDRLERRGVLATFTIVQAAHDAGGRIESVQEPLFGILGDVPSEAMTAITAIMSREKSAHLKEQIKMAHDRIRANGALIGRPPWGFTTEGKKYERRLVPTPEGLKWIPVMFTMIAEGKSLEAVALHLEASGIAPTGIVSDTTAKGKNGKWHARCVAQIIRNPAYMGLRCAMDAKTRRYDGTKILHECTPIVDAGLWTRANDRLDSHPKGKNGGRLADPEARAMLAAVIYCGNPECDATGAPDSPMYPYKAAGIYRCAGRGAHRKGCGNTAPMAAVDATVNKIIAGTFTTPVMERTFIPGTDHDPDVKKLKFRRSHVDQDAPDYVEQIMAITAEIKRLDALDKVPPRWEDTPTGETYAGLYGALSIGERGPWLKGEGFRVTASKTEVTVSQGDVTATETLG